MRRAACSPGGDAEIELRNVDAEERAEDSETTQIVSET